MKKSILVATFLGLTFFSCTKDEESNNAPNAFEVTVTPQLVVGEIKESYINKTSLISPKSSEYQYIVTWTDAIDPDGDAVTYDVVIGANQITTATSVKTATISKDKLATGDNQTVTVTAKDGNGGETTMSKTFVIAKS